MVGETRNLITQALFQSVLIVASILMALAFDEWREELEEDELVDRALYKFKLEIQQNTARLEGASPFNAGLLEFLQKSVAAGDISDVRQLTQMVQGFEPAILERTAWDTAVATGALAKMDYETANKLSFTYSLQLRFTDEHQFNVEQMENRIPLANDNVGFLSMQAVKRFAKVNEAGTELQVIYGEVGGLLADIEEPQD